MAWTWVPPVATGAIGVAGMYFTWLSGRSNRAHTERMAQQERRQQRLAETYVDLLTLTERVGQWTALVRPMVDANPPSPVPVDLPSFEEQARAEALVRAFGSKEVLALFEAWREPVNGILKADFLLTLHRHASERREDSGIDDAEQWQRLMDLREDERSRRKALQAQVARELESRE